MTRHRLAILLVVMAALTLGAAACGDDSDDSNGSSTDTTETTDTSAPSDDDDGTTESTNTPADQLNVRVVEHPMYGDILATRDGYTLYIFTPDDAGDPTCTDACADAWPPLADDDDISPHPLGRSRFGVVTNGAITQVTFDGWPLYTYAGDEAPGDANGQALNGQWYVIGDDGPIGLDD